MNAQVGQTFNPELFLQTQVTESNATELLAVPEGEYTAVSEPISPDSFRSYDIGKGERAGTKGYAIDLSWLINDETGALKEYLGRAPKVRQSVMLDVRNDGTLEFGKGKNVGLGRTREALGQNMNGRPWNFGMLGGAVAKVKVKHRLDAPTGRTYVEVVDIAKA